MPNRVFQGHMHQWVERAQASAVNEVNRLDRKLFADPALDGHLQKIAEKYALDVARLNVSGIEATRKEVEAHVRDFGEMRIVKRKVLEVMIPFNGDEESLKLAPSRSTIISNAVEIRRNALTVTVGDDDNAQREVDTFVSQVNQNIDTLRTESAQAKTQLLEMLRQVAQARKEQIEKEDSRDKKFSFPVRN